MARPRRSSTWAPTLADPPADLVGRFQVTDVRPSNSGGRRPAAAVVGEAVPVQATAFREGHDAMGLTAVLRRPDGTVADSVRMLPVGAGLDRWSAHVRPDAIGDWSFGIEAWSSPWDTWIHRANLKVPAGVDVELELAEGVLLLRRAAQEHTGADRHMLRRAADQLADLTRAPTERLDAAREVADLVGTMPLRDDVTVSGPWPLRVQRRRALVGSWYEFFPRSEGARLRPARSGTLATAAKRLDAISEMGFDVVYLPPVHPIGTTYRKGPNNSPTSRQRDPGSPWAIGSADGGHDALHPDLGTFEDFDAFVARAAALGMEVALDLALQASPDHPWIAAHPEWFTTRADGSIACAQNPPKVYQDIYPLNFDDDPEGLYAEVERIVRGWMAHGVRIFRVDNPHTKPLWVWERLLSCVWSTDPDVLFLAEAFTRPAMMRALAQVGFQQSYTYFTWRTSRSELEEYLIELAQESSDSMRPNLFVNTPDILHAYLQHSGPSGFAIRATLAATLSPSWGVYSGYELFEATPVHPGSEEYLDSEKYQLRPRDWAKARREGRTLAPYLTLLNAIRREHRALQDLRSLRFHPTSSSEVIAYSKTDGEDVVLVVCTLDPHNEQVAAVYWDFAALGLPDQVPVRDHVTGGEWTWTTQTYVRFEPWLAVAHVASVQR